MKRITLLLVLLLTIWGLIAQSEETDQELQETMVELQAEIDDVRAEMKDISGDSDVRVRVETRVSSSKAYMGIYSADLSLTRARELGYKGDYGIVINRISYNTPADKYNLKADDILMKIDDNEITNYKVFLKTLEDYSPGDEVKLTIFRDGEEKVIDFTFGRKGNSFEEEYFTLKDYNDDSASTGHGGFGWTPELYQPDMDDLNHIMNQFGFSDMDDSGLLMQGFHGNFHVGGKFYLGGSYFWYPELSRSKNHVTEDGVMTTRRLRYWTNYWGVSLDRRFRLASWLTTSVGFTVGKSTSMVKITQTAADAGNVNWENIADGMDMSGNNHLELKKEYMIFHPRVATYIKILSWLRLRAEAGYMLGYSWHSGWQAKMMDKSFDMEGSPNTSYNGLTFSIGPWLGF